MTVTEKIKHNDSAIYSAFIKGGTQIHLLKISSVSPPVSGVDPDERIQVKLEVDTDPPEEADFEIKYQLLSVPYHVRMYTPPSPAKYMPCFAGDGNHALKEGTFTIISGIYPKVFL